MTVRYNQSPFYFSNISNSPLDITFQVRASRRHGVIGQLISYNFRYCIKCMLMSDYQYHLPITYKYLYLNAS